MIAQKQTQGFTKHRGKPFDFPAGTEYRYNNRGLQTEIVYADGTKSQSVYDALDRVIKEIDQNENETSIKQGQQHIERPCSCKFEIFRIASATTNDVSIQF